MTHVQLSALSKESNQHTVHAGGVAAHVLTRLLHKPLRWSFYGKALKRSGGCVRRCLVCGQHTSAHLHAAVDFVGGVGRHHAGQCRRLDDDVGVVLASDLGGPDSNADSSTGGSRLEHNDVLGCCMWAARQALQPHACVAGAQDKSVLH